MGTFVFSWFGHTDSLDFFNKKQDQTNSCRNGNNYLPGPLERVIREVNEVIDETEKVERLYLFYAYGGPEYNKNIRQKFYNEIEANQPVSREEKKQYEVGPFMEWLRHQYGIDIVPIAVHLEDPRDYEKIYKTVYRETEKIRENLVKKQINQRDVFIIHLSSGTPQMGTIWLLLAKTKWPDMHLVQTSLDSLDRVTMPFDLAVSWNPYFAGIARKEIKIEGLSGETVKKIKGNSSQLQKALQLASNMARYDFPVLLAGESGTGKELFARMIHESSNRQDKEYRVINCGAIPAGLLESELFGHVKGAFTGADADKKGIFEICDGGTLFLDEIGDLPLVLQVKILRVTDRHEQLIRRVGGTKDIPVNVRIIAATNRNLKEMVIKGEFREDLFRRLAVGYLTLPPLRDRIDDLDLLIDHFVKKINQREQERHSGFSSRTLNREAREFLRKRYWSGNVRELEFTLERALLMFARETTVTLEDVEDAYLPLGKDNEDNDLLNSTLTETHNINDVQAELYLHYLKKAIELRGYKQAAIGRELGLKKGTFEKMLRDGAKAEKNGKTPSAIYRLIAKDATASGVINKKDDKK